MKQEFDGASGGRIMAAPVADLSRERAFDLEMVGRRGDFDQYLALLAYKIRSRLSRQLEGLSDPGDQPMQGKVAFTRLGRDLEDADAVAIIVLPQFNDATWKRSMLSLQAMHPINHYLDLVGERMILFAESDNPQQIKDWSDRVRGEAREGVLVIEVGMLTGTDGWTFANGRLQMCDHPRVPTVTAETMHAVMEDHRSMSLKQLQKMCFHLWDEARRRPGAKEVSKHDFDRYYVDRRDGYRPRGRGIKNG
ncbi:hypothetical protein [Solwaraspora sp. WMMA2065]|uniref:hypothetical protein n=1 Tax=Solwaraspora sp. WMMA2065 TaxID=3015166 RepID=UPI00259B9946|nr:hypothetical protein [Solwaraspora sp. WMMA2065]WJK34468.1 hypothetical protein O7610_28380 [Solwaraspora sp. WMMA2065]